MFKLPASVYNNVLHGSSFKMLAHDPENMNKLIDKILRWVEKEYSTDAQQFKGVTAALYLAAMHMIETGMSEMMENAPEEVKRHAAMLSLFTTESSAKKGDLH